MAAHLDAIDRRILQELQNDGRITNLDLSRRRASSVASYLESHGVSPSRVQMAGRGESEPVATNDTDAGRQQNRRVEVAIYASDKMKADAKAQAGVP